LSKTLPACQIASARQCAGAGFALPACSPAGLACTFSCAVPAVLALINARPLGWLVLFPALCPLGWRLLTLARWAGLYQKPKTKNI